MCMACEGLCGNCSRLHARVRIVVWVLSGPPRGKIGDVLVLLVHFAFLLRRQIFEGLHICLERLLMWKLARRPPAKPWVSPAVCLERFGDSLFNRPMILRLILPRPNVLGLGRGDVACPISKAVALGDEP